MIILYAEDNLDLGSLYQEFLETEFPDSTVVWVHNGEEAIKFLAREPCSIVLCDYKMVPGNGGDVYRYVKEHKLNIPFILYTSEDTLSLPEFDGINNETEHFWILSKPAEPDAVIEKINYAIRNNLLVEEELKNEHQVTLNNSEINKIKIEQFLKLNKATCDVYIQLSSDKWVRLIKNRDINNIEIVRKYIGKGLKYLGITKADHEHFNNILAQTMIQGLALEEDLNLSSEVQNLKVSHQLIQDNLINFGISKATVGLAQKEIEETIEVFSKINGVGELLEVLNNNGDFLYGHSLMTAYLAQIIASSTQWSSRSTTEKLVLAGLFHDISLSNPDFETLELLSFDRDQKIEENLETKDLLPEFLEHPMKSAEMVRKIKGFPPDLDTLIAQHHEDPKGEGFPRKLQSNYIAPLSCVLIIAHDCTNQLWGKDIDWKLRTEIFNDLNEKYDRGNFKTILDAFCSTLTKIS